MNSPLTIFSSDVMITDDTIEIVFKGEKHTYSLSKLSDKLAKASRVEREFYELSPSGYGIHWPLVDEDLSIGAILRTK
jgi:hypothetical protein